MIYLVAWLEGYLDRGQDVAVRVARQLLIRFRSASAFFDLPPAERCRHARLATIRVEKRDPMSRAWARGRRA